MMALNDPIDPATFIPNTEDEHVLADAINACIESSNCLHIHSGDIWAKRIRSQVPQLNINMNLAVQTPSAAKAGTQIPQAQIAEIARRLQPQILQQVQEQIRLQTPVTGVQGGMRGSQWYFVPDEDD
jgi:hypothetical protein